MVIRRGDLGKLSFDCPKQLRTENERRGASRFESFHPFFPIRQWFVHFYRPQRFFVSLAQMCSYSASASVSFRFAHLPFGLSVSEPTREGLKSLAILVVLSASAFVLPTLLKEVAAVYLVAGLFFLFSYVWSLFYIFFNPDMYPSKPRTYHTVPLTFILGLPSVVLVYISYQAYITSTRSLFL